MQRGCRLGVWVTTGEQMRLDDDRDTGTQIIDEIGFGGRCEIRTHGAVADTPDFKSGAFNRSANLPRPGNHGDRRSNLLKPGPFLLV
jgi:hypothetical protein